MLREVAETPPAHVRSPAGPPLTAGLHPSLEVVVTPTCPSCDKPGGALTADPHCEAQTCTWNNCKCGATYHRTTGAGFANTPKPVHFPAKV